MKVLAVTPAYQGVSNETRRCVEAAGLSHFVLIGNSDVYMARSEVANKALGKAEFLLWVDADIVFEPKDVERLLETIEKAPERAAVGSLYASRTRPSLVLKASEADAGRRVAVGEGAEPLKVDAVGFGLTLVRSSVFAALDVPKCDHGYHYFYPRTDRKGFATGEDFGFCYRVQDAGFEVWCDLRVTPGHIAKRVTYWNEQRQGRPESGSLEIGD